MKFVFLSLACMMNYKRSRSTRSWLAAKLLTCVEHVFNRWILLDILKGEVFQKLANNHGNIHGILNFY